MLLIQCPSCSHENTPGERFCAACGVPLHLKPCPACGKVDHVSAKICSGCGAAFPPIVLAHYGTDDASEENAPPDREEHGHLSEHGAVDAGTLAWAPEPVVTSRAWPLIVVAIVAGGIPLLWMNRANLPLPKAWQLQGPNAAGSAVTPVAPPPLLTPAAPPMPVPVAAPAPVPASPAVLAPAPASPAPPTAGASLAHAGTEPVVASSPAQPAATRPPARNRASHHRRNASTSPVAAGEPQETGVPARECSEALTALGLCDGKAGR